MHQSTQRGDNPSPSKRPRTSDPDAEIDSIRRANRVLSHWPAWMRMRVEDLNWDAFDDGGDIDKEALDGSGR